MRTKTFLLLLIFGIILFFTLVIFNGNNNATTPIQSFVSEFNSFQNNLRDSQEKRFQADEQNLQYLGFNQSPKVLSEWSNILPAIVTIIYPGEDEQGIEFCKNMNQMALGHQVYLYNHGMSKSEQFNVATACNATQQSFCSCRLMQFDLSQFPQHVQNVPLRSIRPLVIQHALNIAGAVLYIDSTLRLTSHIQSLLGQKPVGVFATRQAVTALTHPSMMDYFKVNVEGFQFLPMVELSRILLWNTLDVHNKIMLPWIQCILTPECLEPIGAQSQGCRFNKKPPYRYSGCHNYDASALNIALGLAFDFDHANYTFPTRDTFFVPADIFHAQIEENTTLS